MPDCFNLEFYIGKLNFIVSLRCYCFKLFSHFSEIADDVYVTRVASHLVFLSFVCYVSLNVEKNLSSFSSYGICSCRTL